MGRLTSLPAALPCLFLFNLSKWCPFIFALLQVSCIHYVPLAKLEALEVRRRTQKINPRSRRGDMAGEAPRDDIPLWTEANLWALDDEKVGALTNGFSFRTYELFRTLESRLNSNYRFFTCCFGKVANAKANPQDPNRWDDVEVTPAVRAWGDDERFSDGSGAGSNVRVLGQVLGGGAAAAPTQKTQAPGLPLPMPPLPPPQGPPVSDTTAAPSYRRRVDL